MHLPFWLTTALLLPVMLYQGKRVRRTTPRLPEAAGPPEGQYGDGAPTSWTRYTPGLPGNTLRTSSI